MRKDPLGLVLGVYAARFQLLPIISQEGLGLEERGRWSSAYIAGCRVGAIDLESTY